MIAPTKPNRALRAGRVVSEYGDDVNEANLTDLLADAMHLCERSGDDFERCLRMARQHYVAEVNGDEREVPVARFDIEPFTIQDSILNVEIDNRFNLVIHRLEDGLEVRVYPRTAGELWDYPYATFAIDEDEIAEFEAELTKDGGRQ